MRRERMPQGVGRDMLGDAGCLDMVFEDLPRAHACERAPIRIEKQDAFPFTLLQTRPKLARISRHRANRLATDRDEALLAALSENSNEHILEQHVLDAERDPL